MSQEPETGAEMVCIIVAVMPLWGVHCPPLGEGIVEVQQAANPDPFTLV
jgi:hypothetical protein